NRRLGQHNDGTVGGCRKVGVVNTVYIEAETSEIPWLSLRPRFSLGKRTDKQHADALAVREHHRRLIVLAENAGTEGRTQIFGVAPLDSHIRFAVLQISSLPHHWIRELQVGRSLVTTPPQHELPCVLCGWNQCCRKSRRGDAGCVSEQRERTRHR